MKNVSGYMSRFSLENKTALVLGGTGLIGKEIAMAFSEAGANTIIVDINEDKGRTISEEIRKTGLKCEFIQSDLTEPEHVRKVLEEINGIHRIDIVVNAFYPRTSDWGTDVENVTAESWAKNVDMHMNSYCMITKYVSDIMKKNGKGGSIINIGSIYGVVGPDFGVYEGTTITNPPAYAAIKGGITNFTRYIASYYGKYGIRANTICPGGIFDNQKEEFVKNYNRRTPLGRMGRADEIAPVCLFIASDAASYISGATIMVDGGWTSI